MACLPSGTVTFLFTDIQGSTKLWQNETSRMRRALARHDELLKNAVETHCGRVFKTVGDAVCASFPTAMDALLSMIDAQLAIQAEDWDLPAPLKIRAAIHTGEAEERDNDYFGPALNRVARLLSLCYGGQSLLTLVATELVRDDLPEGISLRYLGEHRLKDLIRPEAVYQALHPDLPADFPPLKSLDSFPHNLPVQATRFVGRETLVSAVSGLLQSEDVRLVTIKGMGGMGKTRLAIQSGGELIEKFRDGVFFIDLSDLQDATQVPYAMLRTLKTALPANDCGAENLFAELAEKNMLLILDNFEQVIAAATLVSGLLSRCPSLKILATSREDLGLHGERLVPVRALSLPKSPTRSCADLGPEDLSQSEAVRLFIDRATDANPDYLIDRHNAPTVAEICVRLEGIPLAIELAASRIASMSELAILDHLANRLRLLTSASRDLPQRQRTLRQAIEWSFNLLSETEAALMRRLSVFTGSFLESSVSAVMAGFESSESDMLDQLSGLVRKSLLAHRRDLAGADRYYLLETIRDYTREQLYQHEDAEILLRRHALCYLAEAERCETGLESGAAGHWVDTVDEDYQNLKAALAWFMEHDHPSQAVRLASALTKYWQASGAFQEGIEIFKSLLAKPVPEPGLHDRLRLGLALLLRERGEYHQAAVFAEIALQNARDRKDEEISSRALLELGWCYFRLNDFNAATAVFTEGLRATESAARSRRPLFQLGMSTVLWKRGQSCAALPLLLDCIQGAERTGDDRLCFQAHNNCGGLYAELGRHQEALEQYEQARKKLVCLGNRADQRIVINNLGDLYFKMARYQESLLQYQQLETIAQELNDPVRLSMALCGQAENQRQLGTPDTAYALAQRAYDLATESGNVLDGGIAKRILGELLLEKNQRAEATEALQQAANLLADTGEEDEIARVRRSLALIQ